VRLKEYSSREKVSHIRPSWPDPLFSLGQLAGDTLQQDGSAGVLTFVAEFKSKILATDKRATMEKLIIPFFCIQPV